MRSEGDPNPTVRIRRPQPGQVSQPLPVQPPPPTAPPPPMAPPPPPRQHGQPAQQGPPAAPEELGAGTVRLPYTPDDLPPVVYAPPPKARWRWVVVSVVLAALLLAALIFGVIGLNKGAF